MIDLEKKALLCLSLLIWLTGCTDNPTVQIKTSLPIASKSDGSPMPPESKATATLCSEDWEKLQLIFQSILPRIEAMESAVLWLPTGTAIVIGAAQAQLELSAEMLDISESLLLEAQRTRKELAGLKGLEKLITPPGAN